MRSRRRSLPPSCPARGATRPAGRPPMSGPASRPYSRACPPPRFPVSELPTRLEVEDLQQNLRLVQESLAEKREPAQLRGELERLHPADVAYILEALPLEERLIVWDLVKAERDGEILLEVTDAVRETLIASMDEQELVAATGQLDTDEIADLAPDLPREVIQDVFRSLSVEEREQLREAMSYDEASVGARMDFDMVEVREDVTLEVVLRYLRMLDELPDHTDQLFVVDREGRLQGLLPINTLLVSSADALVGDVTIRDYVQFNPHEDARDAAGAFERYDLVSAPVVDEDGMLVGRMTVNDVVDYIREAQTAEMLA